MINTLKIIETYEFYDGPIFYLGENTDGNKFLIVIYDDKNTWLVSSISNDYVNKLHNQEISFYEAFKSSKDSYIIKEINIKDISDEELIYPNLYFNPQTKGIIEK